MSLILASASPRRRELLEKFGIPFLIDPSTGPENPPAGADAAETVRALSAAKALEVVARHPGCTVIGSDTVVEADGIILGKPRDKDDAFRMLRSLSGREHRVFTGVTVTNGSETLSQAEMTRVFFRDMSDREIEAYIATGEPMDKAGVRLWHRYIWEDKAGGYGIQTPEGRALVKRIEGDYYNVVGLPLKRLASMLQEFGIEIKELPD